jgi:hypothetical protein
VSCQRRTDGHATVVVVVTGTIRASGVMFTPGLRVHLSTGSRPRVFFAMSAPS